MKKSKKDRTKIPNHIHKQEIHKDIQKPITKAINKTKRNKTYRKKNIKKDRKNKHILNNACMTE